MKLESVLSKDGKNQYMQYIFREENLIHRPENLEETDKKLMLVLLSASPLSQEALILYKLLELEGLIEVKEARYDSEKNDLVIDGLGSFDNIECQKKPIILPALLDKNSETIISNDYKQLSKMLFELSNKDSSLFKQRNESLWNSISHLILESLLKPIYLAGYSNDQEVYEINFDLVFNTLDILDNILSRSRYLLGNDMSVLDIRLYTILARFDDIYFIVFKLNNLLIREYSNLSKYLLDMHQTSGIGETTDFEANKKHYYHEWSPFEFEEGDANAPSQPFRQMPESPDRLFWNQNHNRDKFL